MNLQLRLKLKLFHFLNVYFKEGVSAEELIEDDGDLTIDFFDSGLDDGYYPATTNIIATGKVIVQDSTEYYFDSPDGELSQYIWHLLIDGNNVCLQC